MIVFPRKWINLLVKENIWANNFFLWQWLSCSVPSAQGTGKYLRGLSLQVNMLISWLPFHFLTVLGDWLDAKMNPQISLSPRTDFCQFWVTEAIVSYISTLPTTSHTHKSWFSALNDNAVSGAGRRYANSPGRWFIHLWFIFSSPEVAFHGFQTAPHLFSLTVMKKTDVRTRTERVGEVGVAV